MRRLVFLSDSLQQGRTALGWGRVIRHSLAKLFAARFRHQLMPQRTRPVNFFNYKLTFFGLTPSLRKSPCKANYGKNVGHNHPDCLYEVGRYGQHVRVYCWGKRWREWRSPKQLRGWYVHLLYIKELRSFIIPLITYRGRVRKMVSNQIFEKIFALTFGCNLSHT